MGHEMLLDAQASWADCEAEAEESLNGGDLLIVRDVLATLPEISTGSVLLASRCRNTRVKIIPHNFIALTSPQSQILRSNPRSAQPDFRNICGT